MFICIKCLTEGFENEPSIGQSYGPCEICGKTGPCSDIPSKYLEEKKEGETR